MLPFKKGGFMFAIETATPIVPIAISGTAAILPKGHWLVRRGGDVRVAVRPPIPTERLSVEDRDALMATVRSSIAAGLDEVGAASEAPVASGAPAYGVRRSRRHRDAILDRSVRH